MPQEIDNPNAFPHLNPNFDGNWDKEPQRGGMTLRDYFAGQALVMLVDQENQINITSEVQYLERMKVVGKVAYDYADAMLKARLK